MPGLLSLPGERAAALNGRQPAERIAFPQAVARGAVDLDRRLEPAHALVEAVDEIALVASKLEQLGAILRGEPLAEPKRPLVLADGLPVCAGRRGTRGSGGRELEHGFHIARRISVMSEARGVRTCPTERSENGAMESDSLEWADRR